MGAVGDAELNEQRLESSPKSGHQHQGDQELHPAGPIGQAPQLQTNQSKDGIDCGGPAIDGGEHQQPGIKKEDETDEAEHGIRESRPEQIAAEWQHDDAEVELRHPVHRGSDLPV
jgi:hypothetical protein